MDFNEYQTESLKTWIKGRSAKNRALLGIFGEVGEIAEKYKKAHRDKKPVNNIDIAKEIGDVLYYLARLGEYHGYSLEEIAEMNINKLKSRKNRGKLSGSGDNR